MKILLVVESLGFGGIENSFYELIKAAHNDQKSNLHFDIFYMNNDIAPLDWRFKALGCNIFKSDIDRWEMEKQTDAIENYLKTSETKYDVIQGVSFRFAAMLNTIRKRGNVVLPKKVVLQSHMSYHFGYAPFKEYMINLLGKMWLLINKKVITDFIAVSKKAGTSMFLNSFKVIENPIDFQKIADTKKNNSRKEFSENSFTIGTLGRVTKQKNPLFACAIIKCLKDDYNLDAKMIFIGEGNSVEAINSYAKENNLNVEITGHSLHEDALKRLYTDIDLFIFPSLYEGFGIAPVEAQALGLPVIASSEVPSEINITSSVKFLKARCDISEEPVLKDVRKWAQTIYNMYTNNKDIFQNSNQKTVDLGETPFNILAVLQKFCEFYEK